MREATQDQSLRVSAARGEVSVSSRIGVLLLQQNSTQSEDKVSIFFFPDAAQVRLQREREKYKLIIIPAGLAQDATARNYDRECSFLRGDCRLIWRVCINVHRARETGYIYIYNNRETSDVTLRVKDADM